jgi:hypothetical protein
MKKVSTLLTLVLFLVCTTVYAGNYNTQPVINTITIDPNNQNISADYSFIGITDEGVTFNLKRGYTSLDSETYNKVFSTPATITLDGVTYEGTIGEHFSYLTSLAIKKQEASWPFTQAEIDKYGNAGINYLD